ncbi:Uncharacterised protein [Mycobacteroides abscessus subsp. abscessus]|nr:Uncharacterised protein [Mycobacteroides abscessus subsp. abscessus]
MGRGVDLDPEGGQALDHRRAFVGDLPRALLGFGEGGGFGGGGDGLELQGAQGPVRAAVAEAGEQIGVPEDVAAAQPRECPRLGETAQDQHVGDRPPGQ